MGCGLRKLRPSEDSSPGKIYSTLKRPQVETKVGVAYTYRHLDFLVGRDDGTSTLQLSSVRELPAQVLELYRQGFLLAAIHPFVHPCGPEPARRQRQLYRAVLVRLADGVDKCHPEVREPCSLRLEECLSAERFPSAEHIQGYVKKQIQDAADQGIMFVGFIQEPCRVRTHLSSRGDLDEASLSLHSSPSSLHSSRLGQSPSPLVESPTSIRNAPMSLSEDSRQPSQLRRDLVVEEGSDLGVESSVPASPSSRASDLDSPLHNNNDTKACHRTSRLLSSAPAKNGLELFALYNQPCSREAQAKYYTVKVPLRVQQHEEGVPCVEANWLDHMTQHFNNGASLVDGYFHLGDISNDVLPKLVESVFIFQEGQEGDTNGSTAYDAIVVEQWTIIDGVQVKTDYIPLLQSLAIYGWRLTCVLPTPIVKTTSDGSLCTKQIVFLQRPVLPRKRRESKKLIFKTRNKTNKNSVKDAPKGKKKKKKGGTDVPQTPATKDKELEDQRILDDVEPKTFQERKPDEETAEEEDRKNTEPGPHNEIMETRPEPRTREAVEEGERNAVEREDVRMIEAGDQNGEDEEMEEVEEDEQQGETENNGDCVSHELETNKEIVGREEEESEDGEEECQDRQEEGEGSAREERGSEEEVEVIMELQMCRGKAEETDVQPEEGPPLTNGSIGEGPCTRDNMDMEE